MKYTTTNEFTHFNFSESYIQDIQVMEGLLHFYLDNVTILPENSCNRDIREMRANNFLLKMRSYTIELILEEGYQHYNADGKLMHSYDDISVKPEDYTRYLKSFAEGSIYCAKKEENKYIFYIDGVDEKTYQLWLQAKGDVEEWDRFLNKGGELN